MVRRCHLYIIAIKPQYCSVITKFEEKHWCSSPFQCRNSNDTKSKALNWLSKHLCCMFTQLDCCLQFKINRHVSASASSYFMATWQTNSTHILLIDIFCCQTCLTKCSTLVYALGVLHYCLLNTRTGCSSTLVTLSIWHLYSNSGTYWILSSAIRMRYWYVTNAMLLSLSTYQPICWLFLMYNPVLYSIFVIIWWKKYERNQILQHFCSSQNNSNEYVTAFIMHIVLTTRILLVQKEFWIE